MSKQALRGGIRFYDAVSGLLRHAFYISIFAPDAQSSVSSHSVRLISIPNFISICCRIVLNQIYEPSLHTRTPLTREMLPPALTSVSFVCNICKVLLGVQGKSLMHDPYYYIVKLTRAIHLNQASKTHFSVF